VRPEALDKQLSTFKRPSAAHIKAEQDWANGEVIDKYLSWAIRAAQTVGRACNDHPQISRSPHSPRLCVSPKGTGRLALWNLAR